MLMSSVVSAIATVSLPLALNLVPLIPSSARLPSAPSSSALQIPVSRDAEQELLLPSAGAATGQIIASDPSSNINIRYAPSLLARSLGQLRVGDRIAVIDQQASQGGDQWYEVRSTIPSRRLQGWVHSDFVKVSAAQADSESVAAPPASPAETEASEQVGPPNGRPTIRPDVPAEDLPVVLVPTRRSPIARRPIDFELDPRPEVAPQREQLNQQYSQADLDYFLEIATGSEFVRADLPIRKWEQDVKIKLHGTPTAEDGQTLDAVIDELKGLVGSIDIQVVDKTADRANINVYFVDPAEFSSYVPHQNPGRGGFVWIQSSSGAIRGATVLIADRGLTQPQRNHIIREEVTQSLGLLNDSFQYRDSIFFQLWNAVTQYSQRDERVIQMLYRPEVRPGMSRNEALSALRPFVS